MSNDIPTVAVVIPAKNEQENIGRCIRAIRAQNYPADHVAIIVVDNGSTDATCDIARSLGATVLTDAAASIAKLRNIGAENSRGKILAFLDADMIPGQQWLNECAKQLQNDDIGAVGGTLRIPENPTWVERSWCMPRFLRPKIFRTPWLPSGNLVLRRTVFDQIGGFDAALTTCEDVDLCTRIRETERHLVIVDDAWVIHTGESKTLGQFMRKEIWRGRNHLQRASNIFGNAREAVSLFLPVAYLICILVACLLLALTQYRVAIALAVLAQTLPLLRALLVAWRARKVSIIPQLIAVWSVYYFSRAIAVLLSLGTLAHRILRRNPYRAQQI